MIPVRDFGNKTYGLPGMRSRFSQTHYDLLGKGYVLGEIIVPELTEDMTWRYPMRDVPEEKTVIRHVEDVIELPYYVRHSGEAIYVRRGKEVRPAVTDIWHEFPELRVKAKPTHESIEASGYRFLGFVLSETAETENANSISELSSESGCKPVGRWLAEQVFEIPNHVYVDCHAVYAFERTGLLIGIMKGKGCFHLVNESMTRLNPTGKHHEITGMGFVPHCAAIYMQHREGFRNMFDVKELFSLVVDAEYEVFPSSHVFETGPGEKILGEKRDFAVVYRREREKEGFRLVASNGLAEPRGVHIERPKLRLVRPGDGHA